MKRSMKILIQILAVVLIVGTSAGFVSANTWYVRAAGTDSNDCLTAATACASIHAAVEKAVSDGNGVGDTIFVGAGIYITPTVLPRKEGIRIFAGQGGTVTDPFKIIADTTGAVTGDAGAVEVVGGKHGFAIDGANFVTLDGFIIHDQTKGSGVFVDGSNEGLRLQNLRVLGAPSHGITFQSLPATSPRRHDITVLNTTLYNNGSSSTNHYGFQMRSTDHSLVQGLTLFEHVRVAAAINVEKSSNNMFENIVVHHNKAPGFLIENAHSNTFTNILSHTNATGMLFTVSSGNTIRNATLFGNSKDGYKTASGNSQILKNSILAFNGAVGIDDRCFCTAHTNNVLMNTRNFSPGPITDHTSEILANPLFVDSEIYNFRLQQVAAGQPVNSPAVDAGSDTAVVAGIDDATTRSDNVPDSGVVDIGYHYPVL